MIEFDTLKKIEKERNLFSKKYEGVNYWQMVRLNLVNESTSTGNGTDHHRVNVLCDNVLYCIKHIIGDMLEMRKKKRIDILYFDQCSYSNVDGELKDIYFDYFGFEDRYDIYRCYYLKKSFYKSGVGIAVPLTKYYLYRCLSKILNVLREDKEEIRKIKEIENILEKHGNEICIEKEIKRAVMLYKAYKPFYDKLLLKCNPRAVFVVCHYDETLFPLYQACKERGIPVIELQHGLASGVNAYTYVDTSVEGKQLPTHIFTYGEIWNDYIKMPDSTAVVPVGNAFLENRKKRYSNIDMDDKKIVIYSFPDERERLVDLSIYMAKELPEYRVLLKLHPREIQYYGEIEKRITGCRNLEIVDKNKELYELLSSAGHHVAISSTVLYEASIYNSKRYVYSRPNYIARMQPLIDAGLAVIFYEKEEILELVKNKEDKKNTLEKDNRMWKASADYNANHALERIISGQL